MPGRTNTLILLLIAMTCIPSFAAPLERAESALPDCRINDGPCVRTAGSVTVSFGITPRPVVVMRELVFVVEVQERGTSLNGAAVDVDITMPGMYMGRNVVILAERAAGTYEGKGVIVRCPEDGKLWKAVVTVRQGGRTLTVPFLFEVR